MPDLSDAAAQWTQSQIRSAGLFTAPGFLIMMDLFHSGAVSNMVFSFVKTNKSSFMVQK
jgi:hypothetical protein